MGGGRGRDAVLLPQYYLYPNLSEGADNVGGRLRGDMECPFNGVTNSGRVGERVPGTEAWIRAWSRSDYSLACFICCQGYPFSVLAFPFVGPYLSSSDIN